MISRRKILSRTGDDGQPLSDIYQCEGDIWFNVDKFIEVSHRLEENSKNFIRNSV